jgi:hypothetical protein
MGFFEAFPVPEPPEPPQRVRQPISHGPGRNVVPGTFAVDGLLVRRPEFAVFANDFRVYPYGFEFAVTVLRHPWRPDEEQDLRTASPFGNHFRRGHDDPERGRHLRLGVRFADGRDAATGPGLIPPRTPSPQPRPPHIHMRGGHGSNRLWQQTLWVWDLPREGDIDLLYIWPAKDVPASQLTLDGDALREAAGRAVTLWEEPEQEDEDDAAH